MLHDRETPGPSRGVLGVAGLLYTVLSLMDRVLLLTGYVLPVLLLMTAVFLL